jgi:hypothetical protein
MSIRVSGIAKSAVVIGSLVLFGSASAGFAKGGRKISVGDDPSLRQGSPRVVLIEISDFQ